MKIAIVSDSHDNRILFRQAIGYAQKASVEAILHCGDIVAPSTLLEARHSNIPIHAIHGNNTGDLVTLGKLAERDDLSIHYYGQDAEVNLEGVHFFVVHYPHYARAMALTGNYDVVCYGHSHRYETNWVDNIRGGKTLLANPGSSAGLDGPATMMLMNTTTMEIEKVKLAEK